VWWYTPDERSDRPALGLAAGTDASLLLDIGASPAHTRAFLDATAGLGLPPLRAAVVTHWHWDHSFGGAALDVPIAGQRETHRELVHQAALDWSDAALDARVEAGTELAFCRDMIAVELPDRRGLEIVAPQLVFDDRLTFDLGGVTADVQHVGGDHAADSCVIWIAEDGLLFLGDCLYPRLYAPIDHYTPATLRDLVERLAAYEARAAIAGHSDELLDRAAFADWLDTLARAATAAEDLGPAALDLARGEEELETIQLVLNGMR
jgi:glyoxylase-like metal-dependent hydrolase (beta-lactamase superfamily II)